MCRLSDLEARRARKEPPESVGNVECRGLDAVGGRGYGEVNWVETAIYNLPSEDVFRGVEDHLEGVEHVGGGIWR